MADQRLAAYIQEQLREGYDINTIRSYLVKYGYSAAQINDAVSQIYRPAVKHVVHLSKTALVAVIFISLGLIIIGAAIFLTAPKTPSQLLDLKIDIITASVEQGGNLQFNIELLNLGSAKRYDVSLSHEILDSENKIISAKEETAALETRTSKKSDIRIAEGTKPGNYLLRTTASYNDKTARATDSFKVYKEEIEPTCFDNIQNQGEEGVDCGGPCGQCKKCPANCDDNSKCTRDYCSASTGYECRNENIEPCCGNLECESGESYGSCQSDCKKTEDITREPSTAPWETAEGIKDVAARDEQEAVRICSAINLESQKDQCFYNLAEALSKEEYCLSINDERTKDKCYSTAAELKNNKALCEKIVRDSRKDSCYMNFVLKGDYTVCDNVINRYLKKSCESLRELNETKPAT